MDFDEKGCIVLFTYLLTHSLKQFTISSQFFQMFTPSELRQSGTKTDKMWCKKNTYLKQDSPSGLDCGSGHFNDTPLA